MAINLATKFLPYVDEKFSTESKKSEPGFRLDRSAYCEGVQGQHFPDE